MDIIANKILIINHNLKDKIKLNYFELLFYTVLIFSFIVRVINLNYNSAFNDEAIYIVVGKLGLFTSDWWSYGASSWMAGLPYIYPVLSALAYQVGGLLGSRLLNVIFGTIIVEEIYRFTKLINLFDKKTNQIAAIIAAFISGFSAVGIYTSKLATYDTASFLLMIAGINSFLRAKNYANGKYYFITSFCLLSAFLTKIVVAVYFPLLFIISLFILRKRSAKHKKLAVIYLFSPFILGIIFYIFFHFDNLITYILTHRNLGLVDDNKEILNLIWQVSGLVIIMSIPSVLALFKYRKVKAGVSLIALSLIIPVFHLTLSRYATLDKHMYLSIIFLSSVIGYGVSLFLKMNYGALKQLFQISFLFLAFFYFVTSYQLLYQIEHSWKSTYSLQNFLQQKIKPGDKILTEDGGAVILTLYDKIFPPKDIVTFDWIDYSELKGDRGYLQAIKDSYFDYIELDDQFTGKEALIANIRDEMVGNYSLIYKVDNFEVFEKNI